MLKQSGFVGVFLAFALAGQSAAQQSSDVDNCTRELAAGDWSGELWFSEPYFSSVEEGTMHYTYRHLPTGFALFVDVHDGEHEEYSYGSIHNMLSAPDVVERVEALPKNTDIVSTNFMGRLAVTVTHEPDDWAWGIEGRLMRMYSPVDAGQRYSIEQYPQSDGPEEVVQHLTTNALSDFTLQVTFDPSGGEPISLINSRLDTRGLVQLVDQSSALVRDIMQTCEVAPGR